MKLSRQVSACQPLDPFSQTAVFDAEQSQNSVRERREPRLTCHLRGGGSRGARVGQRAINTCTHAVLTVVEHDYMVVGVDLWERGGVVTGHRAEVDSRSSGHFRASL